MTLIDNIRNNPLRSLGVFVDDSKAQESNNYNRIVAYAKVGESVDLPMPYDAVLGAIERTAQSLDNAQQRISLPKDRVRCALFWIAKDDTRRWSAILNSAVDSLINGQLIDAINKYEALIYDPKNFEDFIKAATKGLTPCTPDEAADFVIEAFADVIDRITDQLLLVDKPLPSKILARLFGDDSESIRAVISEVLDFENTMYNFSDFETVVHKAVKTIDLYGLILGKDSDKYQVYSEFLATEILKKGGVVIDILGNWADKSKGAEALDSLVREMDYVYRYCTQTVERLAEQANITPYISVEADKLKEAYSTRKDYSEDMSQILRKEYKNRLFWSGVAIFAIYLIIFASM